MVAKSLGSRAGTRLTNPVTTRALVDGSERARLERLAAGEGQLAIRARIVLLAGEGLPDTAIAARLGVSRPTVALWRERYAADPEALSDLPRTGRPPVVREAVVLAAGATRPPGRGPDATWSARSLASALGISAFSVRKVWRRWRVRPGQPPIHGTPALSGSVGAVAGLYLNPPDAAVVVRLDHTEPEPLPPGLAEVVTERPATAPDATEPIAKVLRAIDDARTLVPDECFPQQRDRDLVHFLRAVVATSGAARLAVVIARPQMLNSRLVREWAADHDSMPLVLPVADIGWTEVLEALVAMAREPANAVCRCRAAAVLREHTEALLAVSDRSVDCVSWPGALG